MLGMTHLGDVAADDRAPEDTPASAFRGDVLEQLEYWMRAARNITANEDEAEDLVQETVLKLFERAQSGATPATNLRAYGTAMMRNAYASSRRSPRMRKAARAGSSLEEPHEPYVTDDVSAVDLGDEVAALGRAMQTVPPDHRAVLTARFVEGMSPRELEGRFGRNSAAVSNLIARAKQSLRRALLIEYLARGGADCAHSARNLPPRVQLSVDEHGPSEPGLDHARECDRCRRNWRAFALASTALGVVPLLVASGAGPGATAAAASQAGVQAAGDASSDAAGGLSDGGPTTLPPAAPEGVGAIIRNVIASPTTLVFGVVCIVAAAWIFVQAYAGAPATLQQPFTRAVVDGQPAGIEPPEARYEADLKLNAAGALERLTARFWIEEHGSWKLDELTLVLPARAGIAETPGGLDCVTSESVTRCETRGAAEVNESFMFVIDSAGSSGEFKLQLRASSGDRTFVGDADGSWDPGGSR